MAYKIPQECSGCNTCLPHCPTHAISAHEGEYWINPILCNGCEGFFPEPQCLTICPTAIPLPYQAVKGRTKSITAHLISSPILFPDGKTFPFASSIVIWEACNLLAQRDSLPIEFSPDGLAHYHKSIGSSQGSMTLSIPLPQKGTEKSSSLDHLDIRSACLHLIFAAYSTEIESPWQQSFTVTDKHLESYLGLEKRKDLSKIARLTLLKSWVEQACLIQVTMNWPSQGSVKGFSLHQDPLWRLLKVHHHFQKDELGCNHLVGLTWELQAGSWAHYFLNRKGCHLKESFYQYSSLPLSLLRAVMSHWQQHEGGVRLLLWLIFKTRIGGQQRITLPTLMRIAYGETQVLQSSRYPQERNRLIRTFEGDLQMLNSYGVKPIFDPITYPTEIQPLWVKLESIPDDAEEAIDFWIEDANSGSHLTSYGTKDKWNLLMHARILSFELPLDWIPVGKSKKISRENKIQRSRRTKKSTQPRLSVSEPSQLILTGSEISQARQQLGLSQRELAQRTGKSQSWIRDVESERFQLRASDQQILREILKLG